MEKSKQANKQNTDSVKPAASNPLKSRVSNPITDTGIIARINNINAQKTNNRLYSGYASNTVSKKSADFTGFINEFNSVLKDKHTVSDLLGTMHTLFTDKLNCLFTACA